MGTPHKHAEVLRAIADGKDVQWSTIQEEWNDRIGGLDPIGDYELNWRIKPEPKPDVVRWVSAHALESDGSAYVSNGFAVRNTTSNIKLTFDGETGKLKSAEGLQ